MGKHEGSLRAQIRIALFPSHFTLRISYLCWFVPLLLLVISGSRSVLAQTPSGAVGVYYVGHEDPIAEAINLAAPYVVRVDQPELAQVLVVNDFLPRDEETVRLFRSQVQQGDVGLVVFCGAQFPQTIEDLSALLGVSAFGMAYTDRRLPVAIGSEADTLQQTIAWNSAPEIQARTVISNPNLLRPIITTSTREPLIQRIRGREAAQIYIVGGWFNATDNIEWQSWPYFRYLVYRLIVEAANTPRPLLFSNYPVSPVPHGNLRLIIMGGSIALMLITAWLLYFTRRYLFLHTETLSSTVRAMTSTPQLQTGWGQAGFHRPLAGLLTLTTPYLLLFVLFMTYRTHIVPQDLIPWAQPLRFWEATSRWFNVIWLLFDAGTGIATIYYFTTLRNQHLREAFRYFQFYVWWQLLSGVVQVGGIILVSTLIIPGTTLAHLSFYFIAHAIIQFPGFFQVFRLLFRAIQRLDYAQYLTFIITIGPIALQSSAILLLKQWGADLPAIGEILGSILGLGIGLYLTEAMAFVVGLLLYRRLGYSLRTLWLPTFDQRIMKKVLGFGMQLVFGTIFVPLVVLVQTDILPQWIPTYVDPGPSWRMALSFAAVYEVLALGLYNGMLPAMTEALTHGYKTLLRYYISQGLHYGMWFSLFLLTAFSATGERIILGILGPQYAGAIQWIIPALGWGALQWPAWTANQVLIATGHPARISWLTIVEQVVRLGVTLALLPILGTQSLLLAYVIALVLRVIIAWIMIARLVGRTHIFVWQTLVAPGAASILMYTLLRAVGGRWGFPTMTSSLILAFVVLFPALPLYGFLTALFGGWDDGGVDELQRAMRISGVGLPAAWMLVTGVRLGAFSPLHGIFPISLRSLAEEEARALTTLERSPGE